MSKTKKCQIMCFCYSALLLIVGTSIYFFIGDNDTYISQLFNFKTIKINNNSILLFIRSYAPDFLWSAAFVLAVQGITDLKGKKQFLLLFCALLGIIFEILQRFNIVNGTYDLLDIAVYFIGTLFAILIIKILWRKNNE